MNIDDKFIIYSDPFVNDKNEFDMRYKKIEKVPDKGELFNHQEFAKLYMKNYDRVLVISKPGTGKTCLAIGVAEYFSEIYFNDVNIARIKNCIIMTRGDILVENFKNEILNTCTKKGKYTISEDVVGQTRKVKKAKLLSKFYTFKKFQSFANELSRMTDETKLKLFSNTLFIVDEVQNIPFESGKSNLYEMYYSLFSLLKTCKIMLLSATPITNDPREFVQIMNLILPKEKQIDEKKIRWNNVTYKDLKNIQGHILFSEKFEALPKIQYEEAMKALPSKYSLNIYNIYDSFSETVITDNDSLHYSVSGCIMYGRQRQVYHDDFARLIPQDQLGSDKEKVADVGEFYLKPLEISNFVYPDYKDKMNAGNIKPYGKEGYNFYFGDLELDVNSEIGRIQRKEGNLRRNYLQNEITQNLRLYSTKYDKAIQHMQYLIKQKKFYKSFIYHSMVEGSGLAIFSKCVEYILGYQEFDAKQEITERSFDTMEKSRRYFVLTGNTSKNEIDNVMRLFNHPKNVNGEYLKLILGSRVTSEGLSFKNTTDVYLLSVPWNLPSEYQSINRILRVGSFNLLLENNNVDVGIHRFVSYYSEINEDDPVSELDWDYSKIKIEDDYKLAKVKKQEDEDVPIWHSIEIYIYQLAIKKEKNIAKTMYIAKQYASDCVNGKDRNTNDPLFDYTYDCNFEKCDYECIPINIANYSDNDYSRYLNDTVLVNKILPTLRAMFSVNYMIDIPSLIFILKEKFEKDEIAIIFTLNDIIISRITFTDRNGYLRYVYYRNGFLLLGNTSDDDFKYIENKKIFNPINIFEEVKEVPNYEKYEKEYENFDFSKITLEQRMKLHTPLRWFFNVKFTVKKMKKKKILEEKEYALDVNVIPIIDYEKVMLTNYIYNLYTVNGPIRFKMNNIWQTATSDNEFKDLWEEIKEVLKSQMIEWINTYRPNAPIEVDTGNSTILDKSNYVDLIYGFLTPENNFIIANVNKDTSGYKNLIVGKLCKSLKTEEIKDIYTKLKIPITKTSILENCTNLISALTISDKIIDLRY